jgi:hypothetical protein
VLIFEDGMRFLIEEEPRDPLTSKEMPGDPLTDEDVAALDSLCREALIPIWEGNGAYTLYAIPPGAP